MGVKKLKKKLKKMHARLLRLNEYHTSATCRVEERVHKLAHTTHEAADGMQADLNRLRARVYTLERGITYTVTCVGAGGGAGGLTMGTGGAFGGVGGHSQTVTAVGGGGGGAGGHAPVVATGGPMPRMEPAGPPGSVTSTRQVGDLAPEGP